MKCPDSKRNAGMDNGDQPELVPGTEEALGEETVVITAGELVDNIGYAGPGTRINVNVNNQKTGAVESGLTTWSTDMAGRGLQFYFTKIQRGLTL
jgi:hypothetical protein